jgi:DNA repair protein RadC
MALVAVSATRQALRMAIRDWPADERPREKLLSRGAAALSDAELLAILLRTGIRGHSAVHLAREVLQSFRSLRKLIAADRLRFCAEPGLGLARFAELQAAVEISRRHLVETMRAGPSLASPRATRDFLIARLRDLEHEVFCCLYLDNRHRLIHFEELFRGTIDGASVHPREIVKRALHWNCAAIIVAHNHPSGVAEPSQADEFITHRIKDALALVDIRLLDHIVGGFRSVTTAFKIYQWLGFRRINREYRIRLPDGDTIRLIFWRMFLRPGLQPPGLCAIFQGLVANGQLPSSVVVFSRRQ